MSQQLLAELETQKQLYKNEISNIKFIKNKKALQLKEEAEKIKYTNRNNVNVYQLKNLPSKSEIYNDSKKRFRSAWKDPGYSNNEFSVVPILKPKFLSSWTKQKCSEPTRNNPSSPTKILRINHHSQPFPQGSPQHLYPKRFQKYLQNREEEYLDYTTRKSKYEKLHWEVRREQLERDNRQAFRLVNSVQNQHFGHGNHSTWEKTIKQNSWDKQ